MKLFTCITVFILLISTSLSATKKKIEAIKIDSPIRLDAVLDESVYLNTQPATNFLQIQPYNGQPSYQQTEAWIFYDERSIYVSAMLHDNRPDSIYNYLTERDDTGASDYFSVTIDPFNQGQLSYGFTVTPAGVQVDEKSIRSSFGDLESSTWDAVWECKTKITNDGWVVEMRIPFSEIRYSEKTGSDWGINFFRYIPRYNSNNSWNFIDRNITGTLLQEGVLGGMSGIKPPLRLSISPYFSSYVEKTSLGTRSMYKGGLDLKYGINESFTLDMMLIPDFGQVQSDDKFVNLTPYEQYYSEKRQFFTEGTELFDRGRLFYSRRIGSSPKTSPFMYLKADEVLTSSPSETQLVNATKVSGRTSKGWGIGVLNAMTVPSTATFLDTTNAMERSVQLQPFTNYNVSVVDKSLNNSSFISLINTNVSMLGSSFRANATATEFAFRDKNMNWALSGRAGVSLRGDSSLESGFSGYLNLEKNKGSIRYSVSQTFYDDKYNINDLGYLQHNNELSTSSRLSYQKVEPFWIFRELSGSLNLTYSMLYNPRAYASFNSFAFWNFSFKNNYSLSWISTLQDIAHDYYETRTFGRYYLTPRNFSNRLTLRSDWRKPLSVNLTVGQGKHISTNEHSFNASLNSDMKIGQKVKLGYSYSLSNQYNDRGFAKKVGNDLIFAVRDVRTLTNVLEASYVLNNKTSVNVRTRHYWSSVQNSKFANLQLDGSLITIPTDYGMNQNYNAFSVDAYYKWVFAPGSEFVVAWKNAGSSFQTNVVNSYADNLRHSFENPLNNLSLKVLYFIDYSTAKSALKF